MSSVLKFLGNNSVKAKFLKIDRKYFGKAIIAGNAGFGNRNWDTLTGRFLLYLENNKSGSTSDKVDLITTLRSQPMNIKIFDVARLSSLDDKSEVVPNKNEIYKLINLIDSQCCHRVNGFNIEDTFSLLHSSMNVIGYKITTTKFFHAALAHVINKIDQLNKNELINLLFLIGLLKKDAGAQNMIRKCIQLFDSKYINDLTKEDLCIICNSTFKTSTKIKNPLLLKKIKLYLNDNLNLLNDPAVFVTLIKTLRHNRCQDEDILSTITCTIFSNKTLQYYSFSALCHILALYADFLYYDENILNSFKTKCLQQLKDSAFKSKEAYLEEQPRTKDIKRFLWALSNLNHKLTKEDIDNIIMPQISIRIDAGEFTNDPGSLVQIILYLWMMQYKAYNLINTFLTKEVAKYIRAKNLPSQDSLNLLLTCIYYEDPKLYQQLGIRPQKVSDYKLNIQLGKRPTLKRIVDNLRTVAVENNIDKYEIGCQVPYINIIGITGFQKKIYKTVHIEVLDEYTCLKNTENVPTGLMQLKLRILDRCDEALVVVEERDIAECSDCEMNHILGDEISLVC